jgi:quercetin dioxygenase-like cupin family protein
MGDKGKTINPETETWELADLVSYQSAAVVSRTILEKKAGTVTLFAFDEEQGLSEHTAPFDAMVLLLEGEAEITISNTPYHLRKGEILLMPANQPHAVQAIRRFKMLLIMIRSD